MSKTPFIADMSLVRGFDYYTGATYEIQLANADFHDALGGGGRYDNLASTMTKSHLPGVGMSMGITRAISVGLKLGLLKIEQKTATQVLIVNVDKTDKSKMIETAQILRNRGIRAEMYLEGGKLAKQLKYANDKGIPYVWFDIDSTVRDMTSGEQVPADAKTWNPV